MAAACPLLLLLLCCLLFMHTYSFEDAQNKPIVELNSALQERLLSLRNSDWGWDFGNTPRAVIALSLANETFFRPENHISTLIKKQLQLEIALKLARQHTEPISAGNFALYVNALLAICQDPHDFFGFNLVRKMKHAVIVSDYEEAFRALTLCNAGHHLHKHDLQSLHHILKKSSTSLHNPDIKAVVIMALVCSNQMHSNISENSLLHKSYKLLKSYQEMDCRFVSIYSTALVRQALISVGDFENIWNLNQTVICIKDQYEKADVNSSVLSYFFTLPVLNLKSMVSLKSVDCHSRAKQENNESNDVFAVSFNGEADGPLNAVVYSIECEFCEFQNNVNVISTIVMIQNGKSLLQGLEKAALSDDRFQYSTKNTSAGLLLQSMAGFENDVHNNRYWMIYQYKNSLNKYKLLDKGITMIRPKDNEYYVFWYRQF